MKIRFPQVLGPLLAAASLLAATALMGAARADTVLLSEAAYPEGPLGATASCCTSNMPVPE